MLNGEIERCVSCLSRLLTRRKIPSCDEIQLIVCYLRMIHDSGIIQCVQLYVKYFLQKWLDPLIQPPCKGFYRTSSCVSSGEVLGGPPRFVPAGTGSC